jgi:hypothetical protein
MSSQIGQFFIGTYGYPIAFLLTGLTSSDLAAIQTMNLTITRPDDSTIVAAATLVNGAAQYIFKQGDLVLPKTHHWELIINSSGGRVLAVRGTFEVQENP